MPLNSLWESNLPLCVGSSHTALAPTHTFGQDSGRRLGVEGLTL